MRIMMALTFLFAAACGGSQPKPEGAIVKEGSAAPENCCCKSNPLTAEDGQPVYELANRMECSSKQGACVDEVQCQGKAQPE